MVVSEGVALLECKGFGACSEGQTGTSWLSLVASWGRTFATSKSANVAVVESALDDMNVLS